MSRLFEQYNSEIKKSMQEKFQYGNVMEIPKLEKIVINIGVGVLPDHIRFQGR